MPPTTAHQPDSRHACACLFVVLLLMTIGSGAMYVIAVVLPAVQAEFGVARADASLPYTLMMIGFGLGGIAMGKLADRFGVMPVVLIGAAGLGSGFIAAGIVSRGSSRGSSATASAGCARSCSARCLLNLTIALFVLSRVRLRPAPGRSQAA